MPKKQTSPSSEVPDAPKAPTAPVQVKIFSDNRVVPIKHLKPNTWNPKKAIEDDQENLRQFEDTKRSLLINGQIDPIIVREIGKDKFEIVNGYHRHRAMVELGCTEIEIKNLGKISNYVARRMSLVTEKIKVPLNNIMLAKFLKEFTEEEEYKIEDVPFSQAELDQTIGALTFDWAGYEENSKNKDGEGEGAREGDAAGAFRIVVPETYVPKWDTLKRYYGDVSDAELLCTLIDDALDARGEEGESV